MAQITCQSEGSHLGNAGQMKPYSYNEIMFYKKGANQMIVDALSDLDKNYRDKFFGPYMDYNADVASIIDLLQSRGLTLQEIGKLGGRIDGSFPQKVQYGNEKVTGPFREKIEKFRDPCYLLATHLSPTTGKSKLDDKPLIDSVIDTILQRLKKIPARVLLKRGIRGVTLSLKQFSSEENLNQNGVLDDIYIIAVDREQCSSPAKLKETILHELDDLRTQIEQMPSPEQDPPDAPFDINGDEYGKDFL
ncbi:hypothetical protein, partial [uncultured Gimesia sp.]|uniref:hypothetical protein n=1 Tax=uncultured Gimesia sp. TaxID=1678688 RepID=UPI0026186EB0